MGHLADFNTQILKIDISALKALAQSYAIIDSVPTSDLSPAYAAGDRRRRPMIWIDSQDVQNLYQNGHLKKVNKGYAFTYVAERALIEGRWSLMDDGKFKEGETREVYIPQGVKRSVRRRNAHHILRRLSKERGPNNTPFLSAAEVQAGELFQRDYNSFYGGGNITQSTESVRVDRTRQNTVERDMVRSLDSGRAYKAAVDVLGPSLDQAAFIICGEGKSLDQLEREQSWSRGSGRMILKLALQRLTLHYGTIPGMQAN
ncbi:MAG: DUF6456 domain-containing protein [Maricaulaceae bacterium]